MGWETEAIPILIAGNQLIVNQFGIFFYNGKPAANNLLLAEVPVDYTDPFGNKAFAGLNLYKPFSAGRYQLLNFSQLSNSIILYFSATGQNTWIQGAFWAYPGTTSINLSTDGLNIFPVTGGLVPAVNINGILQLQAQSAFNTAFDVLGYNILWANAQSNLVLQNNAGSVAAVSWPGLVPATQVDTTTNSVLNVATSGPVTATWSVPANDGVKGTKYVIETDISFTTGPTTIETLTIGIILNGTFTGMATLGTAFNGGALSTNYTCPARLTLVVDDIATNTPHISLDASVSDLSANRLATNSANMGGVANALTWNKTSTNTWAIGVQWGGVGGVGQTASATYSEHHRRAA